MARKIALCGFADSVSSAPWGDDSWEIWGVNDLYAHVPRMNRVFEVHHLEGLGTRRNPKHDEFLRTTNIPVYMVERFPEFPTSIRYPFEDVARFFNTEYFTNSISWMLALAIMENHQVVELPDGRKLRVANPDTEIGLWGIDMASGGVHIEEGKSAPENEYAYQRPSCEYFIGVADGMGFKVLIPDTSDLLKCTAMYGISTTHPLRVKLQTRIQKLKEKKIKLMQEANQKQQELAGLQAAITKLDGTVDGFRYVQGVWTNPLDAGRGEELPLKERFSPLPGSPMAVEHSDNRAQADPADVLAQMGVSVQGGEDG